MTSRASEFMRRHCWLRPLFRAFLALVFMASATPLKAGELRILTSMSGQVFDPFKAQFEILFPDTRIIVLNKNTNAAIEEVLRGNPRRFDIFWASSPEAFDLLDRYNAFLVDAPCAGTGDQNFSIFALSGLGWSLRSDSQLRFPVDWDDLLKPEYRGQIGMARPSRSGTTHMLVERFLQVRGWTDGWRYLLELSGNLSTLTSRSFGVPDGVLNRRFAVGLSIDFLAQSNSPELQFRYGRPVMVTSAKIGILNTSANVKAACEFVTYVLSQEGQRLLLDPQMRRIPANPAIRAEAADQIPQEMQDALRLTWMQYNSRTAQQRYWTVNALFDVFVTATLSQRRALWQRLYALPLTTDPARISKLRQLLVLMPVSEAESMQYELNETPFRVTNLTTNNPSQEAVLLTWRSLNEAILSEADALLDQLEMATR
ncbi:MAG: ABC transporter substrate-binding protein [Paracoccaceae bacterium]